MSRLPLFSQHSRHWQSNRYVYPVISRRSRGLSIGVNLNPDRVCNFDCVYCCVDRSDFVRGKPGGAKVPPVDLQVLGEELAHMVHLAVSGELLAQPPFDQTPAHLRRLNDVAFSGDGEPTSFAGFGEACRVAAETLERQRLAGVKIVVITNATLLHRPAVRAAMGYLDQHNGEIWAKLEAGDEEYYRLIERTNIPLSRVLENIARCGLEREIVIQSLFMRLHGQGPTPAQVEAYIQRLAELKARGARLRLVQVYTVARSTAEAYVTALDADELEAIAARVRALGLAAEVYP